MLTQNNQDNSDWKDEAEKIEAQVWAYNQGIDGEMLNWMWEEANSKAEFYDLCHKELNRRTVCDYTPEMVEIICSILSSESRQITII